MSTVAKSLVIRPAAAEDIIHVHAIYSHYVVHTITDLHHGTPSLSSFAAEYQSLTSRGLPFFVATSSSLSEISEALYPNESPGKGNILGFIHAFPFRGYKVGYAKTVELCIMCHPDATRGGVGGALMEAFLTALAEGGKVEQILAFMTILEEEAEDQRVKRFYEKWGFSEVGLLEDVANKFGRRVSKRWMQRPVHMNK